MKHTITLTDTGDGVQVDFEQATNGMTDSPMQSLGLNVALIMLLRAVDLSKLGATIYMDPALEVLLSHDHYSAH